MFQLHGFVHEIQKELAHPLHCRTHHLALNIALSIFLPSPATTLSFAFHLAISFVFDIFCSSSSSYSSAGGGRRVPSSVAPSLVPGPSLHYVLRNKHSRRPSHKYDSRTFRGPPEDLFFYRRCSRILWCQSGTFLTDVSPGRASSARLSARILFYVKDGHCHIPLRKYRTHHPLGVELGDQHDSQLSSSLKLCFPLCFGSSFFSILLE
mmetsp:Transcript_13925/g.22204  ORF Transcript_13925/g.22204 Transcript_13925/m.22204 type:complete len:208 (-) Transcript_13925:1118-1741(-)